MSKASGERYIRGMARKRSDPGVKRPRGAGREVFVSHASTDAPLINHFVESLLVRGVGIPQDKIFNTSAATSPIPAGSNFSPEIRAALQAARVVMAVVTPAYLERPFAVAELGAAWAGSKLLPIVLPPLQYSELEGVLDGIQCIKGDDRGKLFELFDVFDVDHLNGDRWFTRAGSNSFASAVDAFLAALPTYAATPAPAPVAKKVTRTPMPSSLAKVDAEKAAFKNLLAGLRAALNFFPEELREAFWCDVVKGWWMIVEPKNLKLDQIVRDAVARGWIVVETDTSDGEPQTLIKPGKASQRSRDVYTQVDALEKLAKSATAEFHRWYEDRYRHPFNPRTDAFWAAHDFAELAKSTG